MLNVYFQDFPVLTAIVSESTKMGETLDCEVISHLCLMCPNTTKNDVTLFTLTEDNVVQCFDLWQKSSISAFTQVFQPIPGHHKTTGS